MDPRWPVVLAANILLVMLAGELNHWLAAAGIYAIPAGLIPVYAALRLSLRPGLAAVALSALLLDAGKPVPFGLSLLVLLALHAVLLVLRLRGFLRGDPPVMLLAAVLGGAVYAAALTLARWHPPPFLGSYLRQAGVDSLASLALTAALAPWFFSLQSAALAALGIDRRAGEEDRPG